MKRNMWVSLCLVAAALFTLGAENSCTAPMDATGDYSGSWQIKITEGEGEEATTRTVECDSLRITLDQDVNLDPPENLTVTGTVYIDDYSCLEDANWPEFLIPEPGEFEVAGTMGANDNRIVLASGGLGAGSVIVFSMNGFGESADPTGDEIPEMTSYSGDWGLAVSFLFFNAGGGGTFEVTRDE